MHAKWLAKTTIDVLRRRKVVRQTDAVLDEYGAGWSSHIPHLERSENLDAWLRIRGVEDVPVFCNVAGRLAHQAFDWNQWNRRAVLEAIKRHFPGARSVTEFGCGLGRNLLFLERELPGVQFYGYELCRPGVELARAAAAKFGSKVQYSQLDYVKGAESEYVFPQTDVAFTMYSLEQLPETNGKAVENILRHVRLGSIHIEPVVEDYPYTFRGVIGRVDHWKADYLRNFDRNIANMGLAERIKVRLDHAHNPLMFPSLYVLKKKPQ